MIFNLINDKILSNLIEYLKTLPFDKYEVVVREKKRSLNQNALYWVYVDYISKHTGYTKDELHYAFKRTFLGEEIKKDIFGKPYIVAKSTTGLKKGEFKEFMDKVQIYAVQQGVVLPTKEYMGYDL